jgi:hypothetical protein
MEELLLSWSKLTGVREYRQAVVTDKIGYSPLLLLKLCMESLIEFFVALIKLLLV